ncbi:UDP-N-acetylglucosamine 1-carboxyvinyltransferase [[Clostridium] colinum]|uniref:UDP-N-acetylglucosamine 1-carboxyvinyltransferase n=1 Tax=[Clostridium] colinum TaxID=36835 RepID=UPI002025B523|nr:UDP-N-acetylglucosamine 1-carboxyvinyltransferase [[Clostridium] colinum]
MEKFLVEQSLNIKGDVYIEGAKNSCLPILAASILSNGKITIKRVPFLSDVNVMCSLLEDLGIGLKKDIKNKSLDIDTSNIFNKDICYELVKKIRASFLLAGPLLARFGKVSIQMPGGCAIGVRPIDLHLKGFKALGADITQEHGIIEIEAKKGLIGTEIYLDFPSVGATENIIMASVLAKGETTISNCATEPEIVDLIDFLNKMGAEIEGGGTETIKIKGVDNLNNCTHTIIPDRIEAGTFLVLGAATRGEINILDINCEHLKAVTSKLKEINVEIEEKDNKIKVFGKNIFKNVDIKTMPYPGFPTDMQPQFMSFMCINKGTSIINETIFENRFMHVSELGLMGANIKVEGNSAIINGVDKITGSKVKATDLRAGAALIIAGLCAEGMTEISDIYHIERGYYNIEEKIKNIGGKIRKIKDN